MSILKVDKHIEINNPNFNDPRTIGIYLKVKGFKLHVVDMYSPTESVGTNKQKRQFYTNPKKTIAKAQKHRKLVTECGLNGTINIVQDASVTSMAKSCWMVHTVTTAMQDWNRFEWHTK